jgi:hypothetical protein
MSQSGTDSGEQVVQFVPRQEARSAASPLDESGQSIVSKIQRAADLSNENCDRAMGLAHKLSIQLRAAEDRINQLEAEVQLHRDRATRAEQWLALIEKEIEDKLIVPSAASRKQPKQ